MKLLTGGKDISELVEKITWSGDTSQVARKINFTVAKNMRDKNFPNVVMNLGDEIIMQDDGGKNIFGGIIFDIDKKGSSKVVTYLAYDLLFYVNQSDVNKSSREHRKVLWQRFAPVWKFPAGNWPLPMGLR